MVRDRPGDKPLSEPIYALIDLKELTSIKTSPAKIFHKVLIHFSNRFNKLVVAKSMLCIIRKFIHHKVRDDIIHSLPNLSSCIFEVWERISNFITRFPGRVIMYPCRDQINPG